LPAAQSVQGPPACDILPYQHSKQLARAVEAVGDDFPAGQLLHIVAAVTEEYLPRVQSVHCVAPVVDENLPVRQFSQLLEPASEYFPVLQLVQVETDVRAVSAENVPATHAVQTVAP